MFLTAAHPFVNQAQTICQRFAFQYTDQLLDTGFQLLLTAEGLQLCWHDQPKLKPLMVDFLRGANAHRRLFGGGRGQTIAKAVGLKSAKTLNVIDGTAGLGKDAFVLASLGCYVTLVERNPVVRALLADGLSRAYRDEHIGPWMQERMQLSDYEQITALPDDISTVDVVYLDPMYPHHTKGVKRSALVKKDMRLFQTLVGHDEDTHQLLKPALTMATRRVVVKRPNYGGFLTEQSPTFQLTMKKNRFDVYVTRLC